MRLLFASIVILLVCFGILFITTYRYEVKRFIRKQTGYEIRKADLLGLMRYNTGEIYLNVGAGDFYHPNWTNLDWPTEHYDYTPDIVHDLRSNKRIVLPDRSVSIIYISHVIEHIPDESVDTLLANCYRLLKEGGILRIAVPDKDLLDAAYKRKDHDFFPQYGHGTSLEEAYKRAIGELPPRGTFDHVSSWTFDKLEARLALVGFIGAYKSGYCQSRSPMLRNPDLFDNTHPSFSLYAEAVK